MKIMSEEQERAKGKLLSKLLLIKSDLQEVNKNYFNKEIRVLVEGIESRVEMLIKNLIKEKMKESQK